MWVITNLLARSTNDDPHDQADALETTDEGYYGPGYRSS